MAVTPGGSSPIRRRPTSTRNYFHGQHSIPRQKPAGVPSVLWDYKHHKPVQMNPSSGIVGSKDFNVFDELGNYFQDTGNRLAKYAAGRSFIDETRMGISDIGKNLEQFANQEMAADPRNRTSPGSLAGGTSRSTPGGRQSQRVGQLDQLLSQLMSNVQGTPPDMHFNQILDDVKQSINKSYNAERKAVKGRSKRAKKETSQNRKELENMYAALSHSYNREAAKQDAETQQDVRQVGGIYNRQANRAEEDVNRTEGQEASLLNKLGISAAGEQTIPSGFNILEKEQSKIRGRKSRAQQIAQERGNVQERYLGKQSGLATEEGAARSADAMSQLQDYLFQNRQAMQDIAARRQQALGTAETDLSGQLSQQQADYQNAVWDRLSDVMGFALDVKGLQSGNKLDRMRIGLDRQGLVDDRKQNQFQNQLDLRQFLADQGGAGAGGAFGENTTLGQTDLGTATRQISTLGPQSGNKVMGVFNNLLSNKDIQNGYILPPGASTKTTITPERAAAMAIDMGKKQGLGPHEIQVLRLAVLDYFK